MKLQRGEYIVHVSDELKFLSETVLYEAIDRARKAFRHCEIPYPPIFYGKIKPLGISFRQSGIVLSAKHLEYYKIGYLLETGIHEIAHWIVDHVYENVKQSHGIEFRNIARFLGCGTSATISDPDFVYRQNAKLHGLILEPQLNEIRKRRKKQQHRFEYKCSCRCHALTTRRHNKLSAFPDCMICGICKGSLSFVRKIS